MAWIRRVGRSGIWSYQLGIALIAVGLMFGAVAYATNPDNHVTISPVGNDGKDVWGKSETITYKADCNPCTGTHNTQFTNTQGLSGGGGSNTASATCSGSKGSTGTYSPLAAKCPDDGSHGAPTTSFKVVDLAHLKIGANNVEGTTQSFAKAATGDVTITAELTSPGATASELRSNFMGWTKTAGDLSFTKTDELTVTVSKATAGSIMLQAKAGASGTTQSVTIVVYDISVTASQSFILAGAGGGSARQSTITVSVTPSSCTGNVSFSIESGTGAGRYSAASLSASSVSLSSGQAQVTLTSSDAVETITVDASYGDITKSVSVWTDYPACDWAFAPDYIDADTTSEVTATLTFYGSPISDRSVSFEVVEVLLSNGEYTTENLSNYATFDDPGPKNTDSNGVATATLRAGEDIGDCSVVYVALVHEGVWVDE